MKEIIEKLESYLQLVVDKRKMYEKEYYEKKQFSQTQKERVEHYYDKEINCKEAIAAIKKL